MAHIPFLPRDDAGRRRFLNNFNAKLPTHAATVGIATAEVASVLADTLFFNYVYDMRELVSQYAQRWTSYKNAARSGGTLGPVPAALALTAAPALVAPDIFGRLSSLAIRIKHHPGYAESIGLDLGILGAEAPEADPAAAKPVLTLGLQAGHPNIGWLKQDMDALEILVDRDGKGFVPLAIDTVPDYLDTAALPAANTGAVWKYKAIYRLDDQQVGQWSDIASIAVGQG